jgi:hypothetical protein
MRNHVFLTPMTPDGKPGEVREIQLSDPGVRKFVAPVSYFATHDETASSVEVQKQIDALLVELPKLKGGARSKADHQLRLLERELRRAVDAEETDRRNSEREQERKRQQPGSLNTRMVHVHSRHQADPFKSAVENMQKTAPTEFRAAVQATRASGKSVEQAIRSSLLK